MDCGDINSWITAISGNGVSSEESQRAYTEWADTYEEVTITNGYTSPIKICESGCKVIPVDKRGGVRILDVRAGTGLVAKEVDSYDVITGSGIFAAEALVSCESLYEMICLVKSAGFIILTARHHLVEENEKYKKLEPLRRKLVGEGKIKEVVQEIWPGYLSGMDGNIWCFQVL